ncbi:MAG TPA: phosphatidate cytidylyltransferase [Anaerolineae bacterium]
MLLTRALSALILAPLVIAAVGAGGWALVGFLIVVLGIAAWEFARLMQRGGFRPTWWIAPILIAAFVIDAMLPAARALPAALSLTLIGSLTWHMRHRGPSVTADWALAIAGGVYLGWAGRQFVEVRALENGAAWLLLILTGTWLADSGAYLVGVRIGRHTLSPALSPKKSWEGLAGGVIIGLVGNALVAAALRLPAIHGAMLGLIGGTIGTLGDLSVSMMKRQVGAKDSGHLIPGHGGALDRIDSLLFVVIAGHLYLVWFAGLPAP